RARRVRTQRKLPRVRLGLRRPRKTVAACAQHTPACARVHDKGTDTREIESRPMKGEPLVRVGVLGAGAWARSAHLPGYRRDCRCRIVAIADTLVDRAREAAREFEIPLALANGRELVERDDIDLVDVCTPSHTHFELAWA